jgi:hypothetical protein
MAAERDEAGSQGPGLSGTGRDAAGMEAGTTRSMSMGDAPGSADVHSGIAFNTQSADQGARERATSRVKDVAGSVADTAGDLGQRARSLAGDVADRAGDFASRARDRVGAVADRATEELEDRGWLSRMRENPLPALGVAFAAGFLLAGGGRGGRGSRVRGELRSAVTAGLSAGLAQGARAFLRNAGAEDGVINSLLENLPVLGGGGSGGGGMSGGGGGGRSGGMQGGRPSGSMQGGRSGGMQGSRGGGPTGGRPGGMQGGGSGGAAGSGRVSGASYGGAAGSASTRQGGSSYGGGTSAGPRRGPSHQENY